MYNLYFKKELVDNEVNADLIFVRTMKYVTALNEHKKEVVEFYDPERFIPAADYFKKAQLVGQYAERAVPTTCGNLEDVSYMNEGNTNNFVLIYITDELGIGYDIESESYEIIPTTYCKDYKQGGWKLNGVCDVVNTMPEIIAKKLLLQQSVKENNKQKIK